MDFQIEDTRSLRLYRFFVLVFHEENVAINYHDYDDNSFDGLWALEGMEWTVEPGRSKEH